MRGRADLTIGGYGVCVLCVGGWVAVGGWGRRGGSGSVCGTSFTLVALLCIISTYEIATVLAGTYDIVNRMVDLDSQ